MFLSIFVMLLNSFVAGYFFADWRDTRDGISFLIFIFNGFWAIFAVISITSSAGVT